MSEARQVKVDNWGIYFLQRLKHFFNRTDYCDLTLQFQDNAQLKVHRLVLSACTEYFELLERTCEMYEDCLVMPDDLQADVVVPIINFMYTGQLEFTLDLLEKFYQTSLIMNMPVLTKLLDAHRHQQKQPPAKPAFTTSNPYYGKRYSKVTKSTPTVGTTSTNKRPFSSAFDGAEPQMESQKQKKPNTDIFSKAECIVKNGKGPSYQFPVFSEKNKHLAKEPRPTRYELPEELDVDNIFDNSFTNISYTSKPLMVHPETTKQYGPKRINLFEEGTSTSRFMNNSSSDIVECRKISVSDGIFGDSVSDHLQDDNSFQSSSHVKDSRDNSQLFDQILENNSSKITIETKNNAQAHNIDHAKIISEVLKKYPHLVKSNKNIKLKILNTAKSNSKKSNSLIEEKVKLKSEAPDFTYETDVINSKEAARLIALGAENIAGPWICLICGTPGKALHFTSYYNFRKHLVEVHNEKAVPTICEYCGLKSHKRNFLVHHKLTKHGIPAPPAYNFPKCNYCNYIAITDALLVKHKTTHSDKSIRFNMLSNQMSTSQKASQRIPGQAMTGDKKNTLQCIYCLRVFLREYNLYAHLKTTHKEVAKNDGIIDDSEDEPEEEKFSTNMKSNNNENSNLISNLVKVEVPITYESPHEDVNEQYQIEQKADGSIHVLTKKPRVILPANRNKILNLGFSTPHQIQNVSSITTTQKIDSPQNTTIKRNEFSQNAYVTQTRSAGGEDTIIIDNNEYILKENQLIPKKEKLSGEFIVAQSSHNTELQSIIPTTSMEYRNVPNSLERKIMIKKSTHVNQPLQIVVSNEEEYKALMDSNQSIIYDEGESHRELCEIGGPENASLETGTVDLDNTQTNNMMLLPDFPMNVPETVCADNSNIVVVYSHPVEDPNKQYSLITTQSLDGEFVQSSAILTQTYETVTTCTPVGTTHTAIDNSWQNNVHANISSANLQTLPVGESITITPIESVQNNNINELQNVHLTTSETVTHEITQTDSVENTYIQSNLINAISQQSNNLSICQQTQILTIPATTLEQTVSINPFVQTNSVNTLEEPKIIETTDEEVSATQEQVVVEETMHQDDNGPPPSNINEHNNITCDSLIEDTNCQEDNTPISIDNNVEKLDMEANDNVAEEFDNGGQNLQGADEGPHVDESIEITASDSGVNPNAVVEQQQCLIEQSTGDATLTKMAKEQIENLALEWSEEESELGLTEQNKKSNENFARKDEDTAESEESIENIQKEVEKHISDGSSTSPGSIVASQDNTGTKDDNVVDSHEKISSLLNDWDDSQDDIDTLATTEKHVENESTSPVNTSSVDKGETTSSVDKVETKNNDNIRSLVSDWDDEDEDENKE